LKGYGKFTAKGRGAQLRAHRVAYELCTADIPTGLFVCHHCDNPSCVNPSHLFTGTHRDNMADALTKGRPVVPLLNAAKTHCPRGHDYATHGVGVKSRKERRCRTCERMMAALRASSR
jgi:HNH endonuclease